jgi:hypothetical protein
MLEIGGKIFVLDFDNMEKIIILDDRYENKKEKITTITESTDSDGKTTKVTEVTEHPKQKQVDASKYETIRLLLEVLFSDLTVFDDSLGFDRAMAGSSLAHKITFNTLLDYGILKEII